ncbi:MAG: hypothetical protein ACI8V5_004171, partial [Limisphaerales bacterium]
MGDAMKMEGRACESVPANAERRKFFSIIALTPNDQPFVNGNKK